MNPNSPQSPNRLLALLPEDDYRLLATHFRSVVFTSGQVLYEPFEPIATVYFPTSAMISLVQVMEDGTTLEAGVIGSNGMLGYPVYLGGQYDIKRALVQIPGEAIALDALILKTVFEQSGALRNVLLRYTQAFIAQISQTAVCNRFHDTEARLSRWLLQSQDFAQSSELKLTQAFLSSMLGVRRASVTVAANALQTAGLIHYSRGRVRILDRDALIGACCECYGTVRAEYDRLLNESP